MRDLMEEEIERDMLGVFVVNKENPVNYAGKVARFETYGAENDKTGTVILEPAYVLTNFVDLDKNLVDYKSKISNQRISFSLDDIVSIIKVNEK